MELLKQRKLFSLFYYVPHVLDLDTGRTYCIGAQDAAISILQNKRELPHYSKAPIYQQYLKLVYETFGFSPWEGFDQYPAYKLLSGEEPDEDDDFLGKADHFCTGFDRKLMYYRGNPDSKYATFPTFFEYFNAFSDKFSKEWCEIEGYDWSKWVEA